MALPTHVARAIDQEAAARGLEPELARAVAWVESRGHQTAVSPAGAIGVFQLMPNTARGLGVDPYDLADNIRGGVTYLAKLVDRFAPSVRDALAGYNWGPANVAAGKTWPSSVRAYVDKVLERREQEGGERSDEAPPSDETSPEPAPATTPDEGELELALGAVLAVIAGTALAWYLAKKRASSKA